MSLKIIFAGTSSAAVPSLNALVDSEHKVIAVFTQPDRPAGRGRHLAASPVKECAVAHSLLVLQPEKIDAAAQSDLKKFDPDLMVVVSYGLFLPKAVLAIPRAGCVNVHFSLLPRWRGASPIQHALLYGDEITGVTVMQIDAGLDTGPILSQEEYLIDPDENSEMLYDRLAKAGAALLIKTINKIEHHHPLPLKAQDNEKATHAPKINKSQGLINWQRSAKEIANQVRAFNPWPVAFTYFQGKPLRIWVAEINDAPADLPPGTVMEANKTGIEVATGDKVLRILSLQLPGRRTMSAREFLNAQDVLPGETVFQMREQDEK